MYYCTTVEPVYSGHLQFLKNVSAITRCPSYRALDFFGKKRTEIKMEDVFRKIRVISINETYFNPIKNGGRRGGGNPSPTSISLVVSTNVGISLKNFLALVLTFLPHWCKILSLHLVPVPNYWIWTKTTPKKSGFSGQIFITLRLR